MTTDDLYRCGSCGRFWHKDEEPPTCQAVICPKVKCQPVAIRIETTPAIPAERRTSIPDGYQPKLMEPTARTGVRVGDRTYAVLVKDPGSGRSWGFYEVSGLVARLEQREKLAEALRQVVWCADSEEPSSVKAAQIAAEALEAAGETNY